ncbi:MAG: ABC transporter ATP-binding protein/permease [Treponema sp.]|jgi:ABC-type multidrug transport system fused ATPase/permease subunit|nr:ABC transporter ATP-binding protein/permease [Treponema sp.]
MKKLFRIAKEAVRYKGWLLLSIFGTLSLTGVNLIAPRIMASMTGLVAAGMTQERFITVLWMAGGLLVLFFLRILFRFLSSYCSHRAAWKLVLELRMKAYNAIQSFSMDYFHNKQTGELLSRVMNDVATFELIYAHITPDIITNFVTLTGVTIILFSINARLALITCIPIPFILFSGWLFSHKVRPNFRKMQKSQGELSAQLQDNFSGIQEIQAFGRQESASEKVLNKGKDFTNNMLRALKLSAVFHPGVEFLTSIGTVIVVGFGGFLALKNQLSVEDVVGFLLYLALFYAPITGLAQLMESAQQALAGAERVIEILDAPQSVKDRPGAQSIGKAEGHISFENVSFSYIEGVTVLEDVSFDIKPGQMVAFVGATGVGKTTLSQLISRFYDPTSGRICLDGHDLRDITLESLRRNISIVLQDTFLFNGTIEENIAFAKPDASFKEVESAARTARIHDDIMEMPDGYQTQVGERGVKLSGGQKQRIAIARAVLCQTPVLILDEATASVDVRTEAHIQQAINEIAGTRTIVTIAHRLSTIRGADVILVFEKGRIVQSGNHAELIEKDGLYRKLCQNISQN